MTTNLADHTLGRIASNRPVAEAIVALVRTHWPDTAPRCEVVGNDDGATLWAIRIDATRLKPFEPLAEVARYFEGCVEALARFGHCDNMPEIPF